MQNLFLRLEEFGNICDTNFCDLGPKSQKFVPQKLMPQHFMPAKINTLNVVGLLEKWLKVIDNAILDLFLHNEPRTSNR